MNQLLAVSRITVGYTLLYSGAMLHQVMTKNLLIAQQQQQQGKTFDRYNSTEMRNADRLLANFMEWLPIFMGPLWALAASDQLTETHVRIAWSYVGTRGLYAALVLAYGVAGNGRNTRLWASTFPGYGCLLYLLYQSVSLVLVLL